MAEISSRYRDRLVRLLDLVDELHGLLNARMAIFYTDSLFESLLPADLAQEASLYQDSTYDRTYQDLLVFCRALYGLPQDITGITPRKPANGFELLAERIFCETCQLKSLSSIPVQSAGQIEPSAKCDSRAKLNGLFMMSEKKYTEVEEMSLFVADYARKTGLNQIVDFGSGKGYLSAMLHMRYDLSVLGLELSQDNVDAARIRTERMRKQWPSLCRKFGGDASEMKNASNNSVDKSGSRLAFVNCAVSKDFDLDDIVSDSALAGPGTEDPGSRSSYLLCGLHTCGYLGNDLMDIFQRNTSAQALVVVGCCYHMMGESFEQAEIDSRKTSYSFPMSKFLIDRQFVLGRSARMLASQAPERILTRGIEQSVRSMFFRALLQLLLSRHGVLLDSMECVGKISVIDRDFVQYVHEAMRILHVTTRILDSDATTVFDEYQHLQSRLGIIIVLRILMGPCIEQIIVLDRAVFLSEQASVAHVDVVALFSPEVSPRTWAVVARKFHLKE